MKQMSNGVGAPSNIVSTHYSYNAQDALYQKSDHMKKDSSSAQFQGPWSQFSDKPKAGRKNNLKHTRTMKE